MFLVRPADMDAATGGRHATDNQFEYLLVGNLYFK